MKCTFLILSLVLLLAINCSTGVGAKAISPNVLYGSLSRDEIVDETGRLRLKFIDLNYDVLFIIFNQLELLDLISVASTDPIVASAAAEVFRHKYQDYRIEVNIFDINNDLGDTRWAGDIGMSIAPNKHIKISNAELGLKILVHLGSGLTKVLVHERYAKYILQGLKTPLNGIQEFAVNIKETVNGVRSFNQLFPQLKRLSVNLKANVDISFVDCEFPHLEFFSTHIDAEASDCSKQFEALIQKNQHIKAIEINGFPTEAIKTINNLLPNLENVTLSDQQIDTRNETLCLENVKHLKLTGINIKHTIFH